MWDRSVWTRVSAQFDTRGVLLAGIVVGGALVGVAAWVAEIGGSVFVGGTAIAAVGVFVGMGVAAVSDGSIGMTTVATLEVLVQAVTAASNSDQARTCMRRRMDATSTVAQALRHGWRGGAFTRAGEYHRGGGRWPTPGISDDE